MSSADPREVGKRFLMSRKVNVASSVFSLSFILSFLAYEVIAQVQLFWIAVLVFILGLEIFLHKKELLLVKTLRLGSIVALAVGGVASAMALVLFSGYGVLGLIATLFVVFLIRSFVLGYVAYNELEPIEPVK